MKTGRARVAVLAGLLLAAQGFALAHGLDLSVHHTADPCETCLHLAVLGHGAEGPVCASPDTVAEPPAVRLPAPRVSNCAPRRHRARAPPRRA